MQKSTVMTAEQIKEIKAATLAYLATTNADTPIEEVQKNIEAIEKAILNN